MRDRGRPRRSAAVPGVLGRQLAALRVVFANPPLRRCQLALGLARAIDLAQLVALAAHLYAAEGVAAVAAYGVVRAVAPALGVPLVAELGSRLGASRVLWLMGAVGAAAAAALATVVALPDTGTAEVLVFAGVMHVVLGAYRPVSYSLMPSLVRTPEELVACTAAAGLLDGATVLAGPLLAGVLLAVTTPAAVLVATAVLLVIAALLTIGLPLPASIPPPEAAATGRGALGQFLTTPEVRVLAALVSTQTFVRGALNVIVIVFAVEALGLGGSAVGLLLGAIGVGALLSLPVAIAVTGRRLYRALAIGLVLWGLPVAAAAAAPHVIVALLLFAVIGLGNNLVDLGAFSALPRAVPDRVLPGVFGLFEATLQIGLALGAAAAGVLLTVIDVRVVMVAVGVLPPLAALLAARRLRTYDSRLGTLDLEIALLRRQPLFVDLPMPVLDALASRLVPTTFTATEVIIREGEPGERYLLIADGSVRIERAGATVAELGRGDAFGEVALVRNVPRTATAVATTEVSARCLDRESLLAALGCDPRAMAAAEAVADERS